MWEAVRVARVCQAILAGILLAIPAHAELLHYEPFVIGPNPSVGAYTLGPLAGQPTAGPAFPSIWSGPWTTRTFLPSTGHVVQAGPITSSPFPTPGGSVRANIEFDGARAGRYFSTPWDDSTTGTYFLSFLVNFGASEQPSDGMGFRSLEFWNAGGTIGNDADVGLAMGYSQWHYFGTGPLQIEPQTARMAVRIGGVVQVLLDAPNSFNEDGLAHFVVMKFELSTNPAGDRVTIFLNPLVIQEPELPSALFSDIDFTLGAIGAPSLYGGTGRGTEFDEIRIGTEFEDVAPFDPEPPPCYGMGEACYQAIIHSMNSYGGDSEADLNHDGRVDLYDLRLWRDNRSDIFGLPEIVSVPEPSGLFLLLAASSLSLNRKRRSQTNCIARALKLVP